MAKSLIIIAVLAVAFAIGVVKANHIPRNLTNGFCREDCDNNICRGVENGTAIPNEQSCTQFFICADGRPIPNSCPPGQWFNPITCVCDSDPNDECIPDNEFQCPPTGIHFFPHDEYCDKFIMCFAGFPVLSRCAEGLHFDRELGTCNFPEKAECLLEICPRENDPENIVFIPSEVDCEKFYICYNGEPIELRCAPGIHFNPITNQCDFPENVNCTIGQPEEPKIPLPHEIECDCVEGIYFEPHPNSCEHYFICAQGESVLLSCAPGFVFDPVKFWCDDAENVQCSVGDDSALPANPNEPSFSIDV